MKSIGSVDNIKIGKKLIGGFILVSILMLSVGIIGSIQMEQIYGNMDKMYTENTVPMLEIANTEVSLNSIRALVFRSLAIPEEHAQDEQRMKNETQNIETILADFRMHPMSESVQQNFTLFEKQWTDYKNAAQEVFDFENAGKMDEAKKSIANGGRHANARRATADTFDKLKKANLKEAEEKANSSKTAKETAIIIMTVLATGTLVISLLIALFLTRSITNPLSQVMDQLKRMSKGEIGRRLSMKRKDEIGNLAETSDRFSDFLEHEVIGAMKKIARGDISVQITPQGENDQITPELMNTVTALSSVISQLNHLSREALQGNLNVRGEVGDLEGSYREIIGGFNDTLEAVIQPLNEAIHLSKEYAACNMNARFSDDISIKGDFIAFRDALDGIGKEVSDALSTVAGEIRDLSANAGTAINGIQDVKRGATTIADNADQTQLNANKSEDGILQVTKAMEDLTITVASVSSHVEAVAKAGIEADNLAKTGIMHAASAEQGMTSIKKTSQETEINITEIMDQMSKISNIIDIITGIADQTNLLALNAAIEAARAGKAGLGFAVVADEVKILASQTSESANRITEMIANLEKKSQNAALAMKEANLAVIEGGEAVQKTINVFTSLTEAVGSISTNMESIAGASEEQAASFEEISANVHEMSTLVKQTANDALGSSATAEEALAVVTQITGMIEKIESVVAATNKEMSRFTFRE